MGLLNFEHMKQKRKERRQIRDVLDADSQLFW